MENLLKETNGLLFQIKNSTVPTVPRMVRDMCSMPRCDFKKKTKKYKRESPAITQLVGDMGKS